MIKIGVASPDLDKQLALLKYYPEVVDQYFRPAIKQAIAILKGGLRSLAPKDTGKAVSSIRSSMKGKGVSLSGSVGFGAKAWYMIIVEHGAKAHPIGETGQAVNVKGNWVTMQMHPGFGGRFFVKQNLENQQTGIMQLFAVANEMTLKAMEVK